MWEWFKWKQNHKEQFPEDFERHSPFAKPWWQAEPQGSGGAEYPLLRFAGEIS